jgi:hypothetical protein
MKKLLFLSILAIGIVGCKKVHVPGEHHHHHADVMVGSKDTIHNETFEYVEIEGSDTIPCVQGDLYIIKSKHNDTLTISKAKEDDARKYLEHHGKG